MAALETVTGTLAGSRLAANEERYGALLADLVGPQAADLDAGTAELPPLLRELGSHGLLDLGIDGNGSLADQFDVLRILARSSLTAAFSVWAQRVVVTYLAAARRGADRTDLPALRSGELPGATAMATAFQDLLGLRPLSVTATPAPDGGLVLDGGIGWASNLFASGFLVVLPVATTGGGRAVVAVRSDLPGVRRGDAPDLLALQATASSGFTLEAVRILDAAVLSDDHGAYLAAVRPTFTLLQAAFCLGLADASLAAVGGELRGASAALAGDRAELRRRAAALELRADRLLDGHVDTTELVRFRLDAARLGTDAAALELRVRGGAAYLRHSPSARRLREAAFLPIQSPTEAQLRWELTRSV